MRTEETDLTTTQPASQRNLEPIMAATQPLSPPELTSENYWFSGDLHQIENVLGRHDSAAKIEDMFQRIFLLVMHDRKGLKTCTDLTV